MSTNDWLSPDDARAALETGTGRGVRVAVIDSGIDTLHPKLEELSVRDQVAFVQDEGRIRLVETDADDTYGHGTAVAGIIHEIAPEAEIGSFRVLDARSLSRSAIIRLGAAEAINRGYHILNCSFSCKGLLKFILPHKEWTDRAWLEGVHVVAACSNEDAFEPVWPAHFTSVLGVNMARTDSPWFFRRPGQQVDFAARGEDVEVAWLDGEVRRQTGSSFAAPRVAAYLARLLSVAPELSPAQAIDLLQRNAKPWTDELEFS